MIASVERLMYGRRFHLAVAVLVAGAAGVSRSGKARRPKAEQTQAPHCPNFLGCADSSSTEGAVQGSASSVLQATPLALPLTLLRGAGPLGQQAQAAFAAHLGRYDTADGVSNRVMLTSALLVLCAYGLGCLRLGWRWSKLRADSYSPQSCACFIDEDTSAPLSSRSISGLTKLHTGKPSHEAACIELETADLIGDTGVSGLTLLPYARETGFSWLPFPLVVFLVFLQGLLLQGGLLYYMVTQLVPNDSLSEEKRRGQSFPVGLVFIAIYVHFINVAQDIPYTYQFLKHFPDFHRENSWRSALMGAILLTDSVVIPCLVLYLGSLYICIARSPVDVVLNSVAVAFLKDIDNWILKLVSTANFFAGTLKGGVVRFPVHAGTMRGVLIAVSYIPLVPAALSAVLLWIALHVYKL